MDLSQSDADLIARTAASEAGDAGPEAMAAVISSIKNRLESGKYGSTISQIILAPHQYEPWSLPRQNQNHPLRVDPQSDDYKQAYQAAMDIFGGNAPDPTNGATHFYDPASQAALGRRAPSWARGQQPTAVVPPHKFYAPEGRVVPNPSPSPQGDVLDRWGVQPPGPDNATPAAPYAQPEDVFTRWGVTQPTGKEAVPEAPEPPLTRQEALTAVQRGLPSQALTDVPVLGPSVNMLQAAGSASLPRPGEAGMTWGDRFNSRLNEQRRADAAYREAYPLASLGANLGGSIAGTALFGMTGLGSRALGLTGSTVGSRAVQGALGQGAIGGIDAALRGEDPYVGMATGAAGGLIGPYAGEGAQYGAKLYGDTAWPAGQLAGVNSVGRGFLTNALSGETPASIAAGQARAGPAGFVSDIVPGLTNLAGGVSDTQGPGQTVIREAYRQRAADVANRVEGYLTNAGLPSTNIEQFRNFITENRAAAADPLYEQWRSMQVQPTQGLKDLMPTLDRLGLLKDAQEHALMRNVPFDRNFFTTGSQKNYPTTESWDMIKRAIDSRIDTAYSGGNNTKAADLITLKNRLINEIDQTPAGPVYQQARQEFADRSELLDEIERGRDTFVGGRSGTSVDQLREELRGLSQPRLMARLAGTGSIIREAMGESVNGSTTQINKLLAPNNQEKLRLMLGPGRADPLIANLQAERFLGSQTTSIVPNFATGASAVTRGERTNALKPQPVNNWWSKLNISQPASFIPPSLSPEAIIGGRREAQTAAALQQIAPLLVQRPGPATNALLTSISQEATNRARASDIGARIGNLLTGLISGVAPATARNLLQGPAQQ